MSTTIRETLRRALSGGFDRKASREQFAQLVEQDEQDARARQATLDAAKAAVDKWRAPEVHLQRVEADGRRQAAAAARRRDLAEFELWCHQQGCVIALRNFIDATYARINGGEPIPSHRHGGLGAALCAATIACRDELWRMTDAQAQEECRRLRAAIEAALEAPAPEPEASA
jgi:hypothetical protein